MFAVTGVMIRFQTTTYTKLIDSLTIVFDTFGAWCHVAHIYLQPLEVAAGTSEAGYKALYQLSYTRFLG
jgi:hypothetical protein